MPALSHKRTVFFSSLLSIDYLASSLYRRRRPFREWVETMMQGTSSEKRRSKTDVKRKIAARWSN
jgi:hypothetical protein